MMQLETDCPIMKAHGCPMFTAYRQAVFEAIACIQDALKKAYPDNIELAVASAKSILDEDTLIFLLTGEEQ